MREAAERQGFLGGGSGVRGGGRARVAGLAPPPASARESARLPGPPGGAAGAPPSWPDAPPSWPDAPRPSSQPHFDDMFGVSFRVGARGAAGRGRGRPTGSRAGSAGEAQGVGRAGPRGAGSGAGPRGARAAWGGGERGAAALPRSRRRWLGSDPGRAGGAGGGAGLGAGARAQPSGCIEWPGRLRLPWRVLVCPEALR